MKAEQGANPNRNVGALTTYLVALRRHDRAHSVTLGNKIPVFS
jgi:hypothetical protein